MPRLMNSLNTENSIHYDDSIIIGPASPPQIRWECVMEVQVGDMGNEVLVDDKSVSKGQGQCEGLGGGGWQGYE